MKAEGFFKKRTAKVILLCLFAGLLFLKMGDEAVFRRYLTTRVFNGDENKYLRIVQSLAADGDLDLSNIWFEKKEMKAVWEKVLSSGSRRFGDLYFVAINGGIYALHMPGVAFLIVPGYKLDSIVFPAAKKRPRARLPFLPRKLLFTLLWLAMLAAVNIALFFRLADRLFDSPLMVTVMFFFLIYASPFPHYLFTVFPDGEAALFFLLGLNAILFPFRSKSINVFLLLLGIGFIPWLHQRFVPLAGGLFLAFLLNHKQSGISRRGLLLVALLLVVLSIPYFYYFYSLTGNISPLSTSAFVGRAHVSPRVIPTGFFGLLFSPSQGSVWKYPWLIVAFLGIYWAFKKDRRLALALLLPVLLYYVTCSASIILGGGSSPVGRFLVPLFPVFLICLGFLLRDLVQRFSYSKLAYYLIFVSLFFLSRKMLYQHFADRHVRPPYGFLSVTGPLDLVWIAESTAILLVPFLSIFLCDKLVLAKKTILNKNAANPGLIK